MSIEKESSGIPEVNVSKRTTKVNLGVIIAVVLFLGGMAGFVIWLSNNN